MVFLNSGMGGEIRFIILLKMDSGLLFLTLEDITKAANPGVYTTIRSKISMGDIVALIHQFNNHKVYLVGHDWGGVVAWHLTIEYPDLLYKMVAINIPHPKVALSFLITNPMQMLRSWHIGFFQLPLIPEFLCSLFNFKIFKNTMLNTSLKGTFSKEDLKKYEQAWKQPGAIKAMINWYRGYKYSKLDRNKKANIPIHIIWGKRDNFLSYKMATLSLKFCLAGSLKFIKEGTHWVHIEKPKVVNETILQFFKATEAIK